MKKITKFVSVILAFCMLLSMLSVCALAEENEVMPQPEEDRKALSLRLYEILNDAWRKR